MIAQKNMSCQSLALFSCPNDIMHFLMFNQAICQLCLIIIKDFIRSCSGLATVGKMTTFWLIKNLIFAPFLTPNVKI